MYDQHFVCKGQQIYFQPWLYLDFQGFCSHVLKLKIFAWKDPMQCIVFVHVVSKERLKIGVLRKLLRDCSCIHSNVWTKSTPSKNRDTGHYLLTQILYYFPIWPRTAKVLRSEYGGQEASWAWRWLLNQPPSPFVWLSHSSLLCRSGVTRPSLSGKS